VYITVDEREKNRENEKELYSFSQQNGNKFSDGKTICWGKFVFRIFCAAPPWRREMT
jgi:hypothetical protein